MCLILDADILSKIMVCFMQHWQMLSGWWVSVYGAAAAQFSANRIMIHPISCGTSSEIVC
jgi:hypothetical protein